MSAPAASPPAAPPEPAAPEAAPETVSFPATGLGEYRMPADAPLLTLKTTAEVYQQDVDLIREHWEDLSDDELVEQAVREYAAMLGRKQLLGERLEFCYENGLPWNPGQPYDDATVEARPAEAR